jgi:anaerobic glycerol-3-phosphate dehydrogenase
MKESGHPTFGRRTEFVKFLIRSEIIAGEVPTLPPSLMGMVFQVFHSQVTMV